MVLVEAQDRQFRHPPGCNAAREGILFRPARYAQTFLHVMFGGTTFASANTNVFAEVTSVLYESEPL